MKGTQLKTGILDSNRKINVYEKSLTLVFTCGYKGFISLKSCEMLAKWRDYFLQMDFESKQY